MEDKSVKRIRNSTAEFLIFTKQNQKDTIDVRVEDENVWLTQKLIAKLFGVMVNTVNYHLKEIFKSDELQEVRVIRKFGITATDGKKYQTNHYSLEAIIAVGFKINSTQAINFRRWANKVLKEFALKGYVLDDVRLKNGAYLNKSYFRDLVLQIRDIRESERNFYQQITDIYATAIDYDLGSPTTRNFFAGVQNKMHFATHGHTAAALICKRASHQKTNMGLTSWKNAPDGKIIKSDVSVAKNYLKQKEIKALNRVVTMYLDYAEDQAENGVPMTMSDWAKKLNVFLRFNQKEVLDDVGKVSAEIAKSFAESEFAKYKPIQDRLFESDFDREMKKYLREQE